MTQAQSWLTGLQTLILGMQQCAAVGMLQNVILHNIPLLLSMQQCAAVRMLQNVNTAELR